MGGICYQGREEGSRDLSITREAHVAKKGTNQVLLSRGWLCAHAVSDGE